MSLPQDQQLESEKEEGTSGILTMKQSPYSEKEREIMAKSNIKARQKMAKLFQRYRENWPQVVSESIKVTVSSNPVAIQGIIKINTTENKEIVPFKVKNIGEESILLTLQKYELVENIFTFRDKNESLIEPLKQHPLNTDESLELFVHISFSHAGFYEQLLSLEFKTDNGSDQVQMMCLFEVTCQTLSSQNRAPANKHSQCKLQTVKRTRINNSKSTVLLKDVVALRVYEVPNSVKDIEGSEKELQSKPLNWENYAWRFHLLLHLEEQEVRTEIEKFNQNHMPVVTDKNQEDILILKVSDIPNSSLAVLSGIQVTVIPTRQSTAKTEYKGWVHDIDEDQVYLKFTNKLPEVFRKVVRCKVTFFQSRIPMRVQHRAAALVYKYNLESFLFPTGQLFPLYPSLKRYVSRKPIPGINPEQSNAIQNIVACSSKPAPYLLIGPPGTGKTITLAHAIKEIFKMRDCHILVCAPSNSATDHICEKILDVCGIDEHKVYRMYPLSFPVANIPHKIKNSANLNSETNALWIPDKMTLMNYNIVVTTLQTVGRLVSGRIPSHHFKYIFVDEAGQASEPECLIPIAGLLKPHRSQVVLAGDPKQLGPIATSCVAQKHGLGVSMLERLMRDFRVYKPSKQRSCKSRFVTRLRRNYRSHPAIMKISNEMFYKGCLISEANLENSLYNTWEQLPKKDFPVIFHGVAGTDEHESKSPSVFNMAEVGVLKEYLKSLISHLYKNGVESIGPGEIGIIAPYRKQVEKILKALKTDKDLMKENLENILVGTVEMFQGREFNVILVSAVRSNPKLTAHQKYTLGFVSDRKRFNVTITRARCLMIVLGDPRLLESDPVWNKLIHYCNGEKACRGITVSAKDDKPTTPPVSWDKGCSNSCTLLEASTPSSL